MEVDGNDLIAMLKVQRNRNADDCAMLKAMCDGYEREIETLKARIADLEKPKE